MKLPFTPEQFLAVFAAYNQAIWPGQIVAYAVALFSVAAVVWRMGGASRLASISLVLMWIVNGAAYHWLQFSRINPAAWGFGGLFLLGALFFLWHGVITGRLTYSFRLSVLPLTGAAMMVYAALVYPIIGSMSGHGWPHSPLLGVAPCPTTIFTFGLLCWADTKVPWMVLIIPFIWAIIGFSAAIYLGIYEDIALLISAVVTVASLAMRNFRRSS